MSEAEWLACEDPEWMLRFVRNSERKHRLYACACARIIWRDVAEPEHLAIETAERVADGLADPAELAPHRPQNMGVAAGSGRTAAEGAIQRAISTTITKLGGYAAFGSYEAARAVAAREVHPVACGFARCVLFPFHPPVRRSAWRTADVVAVAEGAYAERQLPNGTLVPVHLAVLSDALEEAGCADAPLLTHLRSPGPHVRGCWALDLVLGEE